MLAWSQGRELFGTEKSIAARHLHVKENEVDEKWSSPLESVILSLSKKLFVPFCATRNSFCDPRHDHRRMMGFTSDAHSLSRLSQNDPGRLVRTKSKPGSKVFSHCVDGRCDDLADITHAMINRDRWNFVSLWNNGRHSQEWVLDHSQTNHVLPFITALKKTESEVLTTLSATACTFLWYTPRRAGSWSRWSRLLQSWLPVRTPPKRYRAYVLGFSTLSSRE